MNEKKKFSDVILELRKQKGLTQQELANKLHITDKAVSKWERGLSYPDITSISSLAKILEVDVSFLIDLCKSEENPYLKEKQNIKQLTKTILKCLSLAMGVSVFVLNILNKISSKDSILLLSIGMFSLSFVINMNDENNKR